MEQAKIDILEKLLLEDCWGKHHLTENTILHGNKRSDYEEYREALADLVKKGYIVKIKHQPKYAYYLNREMMKEIHEAISSQ